MKPQLHPDAAKNFDDKAQALLAAVAPWAPEAPSEPPTHTFRPGAHVAEHFNAAEIGFKITHQQDQFGRTTARYFEHEGRRFGIEGEKYQALARLSEGIQKTKAFRDLVSTEWVEGAIVDWIKTKFAGEATPKLGDYLAERCEEAVKEHEIWIPVSNFSVQSDLTFGNVVFKTITEELMDRMEETLQSAKEGRDERYAAQIDYSVRRQRSDLQGLAAAAIKVNAEPKRAFEVALRESDRAVAALRVYHVLANTIPEVTSYCAPLGSENVEAVRHLEMEGGSVRRWGEQGVGKPVLHWHLSDHDIREYRAFGFDKVNRMLALENRTKFQEALLDALLLYSRSTREKDLAGRLVYTLVALESILLRNDNEPIQQNVGERMAFTIAKSREERSTVVRNLKSAYALRSKFIHHGHTIEDRETMKTFMFDAWTFFTELANASNRFDTKEEFIDDLEAMKLS